MRFQKTTKKKNHILCDGMAEVAASELSQNVIISSFSNVKHGFPDHFYRVTLDFNEAEKLAVEILKQIGKIEAKQSRKIKRV